jgi:hypothetical protein
MENYAITYARIMVHDCVRTSSNKLIPDWCGYLHPSIRLTEKSKLKLIGLLGVYEIFSYRRNIEKLSGMRINITKFQAQLPLPSMLSTDILCKSCLGTCHRPCWSVALGRNKTTCVDSEISTTENTIRYQRLREEKQETCFDKHYAMSEGLPNSAGKCSLKNNALILSLIFYLFYMI